MRQWWSFAALLGVKGIARLLPSPLAIPTVQRLGRVYARLGLRVGWLLLPPSALALPSQLARVLGEAPGREESKRQIEEYVARRLTNLLLTQLLRVGRGAAGRSLGRSIEVRGREHLERALGRGQGALLISAHFGFPLVIRPILESSGIRWVAAGRPRREANPLPVTADVWTRVRTLHQIRVELAQNHVGLILVDGGLGERVRVPLLRGEVSVGLGAFALAQRVGCPLVPFFVVAPDRPPRFRVDFCPPVPVPSGAEALTEAVREFAGVWGRYVQEYPSHFSQGTWLDQGVP